MPRPPYRICRSLQNAKESDLGHKGNLFYILCGQFDEKKMGVPPYPGGKGKPSKSEGEGVDVMGCDGMRHDVM